MHIVLLSWLWLWMWGDMSLRNVQGPLLHSGDHIVPRILTVDYTIKDNDQCRPIAKKYLFPFTRF